MTAAAPPRPTIRAHRADPPPPPPRRVMTLPCARCGRLLPVRVDLGWLCKPCWDGGAR